MIVTYAASACKPYGTLGVDSYATPERRLFPDDPRRRRRSFAGPRYILPFCIVNEVLICGLPSGPGLANAVSAICASAACSVSKRPRLDQRGQDRAKSLDAPRKRRRSAASSGQGQPCRSR